MSKEYCLKFGEVCPPTTDAVMRDYCKRPGKVDENGNIIYMTEQHHKKECDINNIIKKYDRTGLISHVSKMEAKYGNMTGLDFKNAHDMVINAKEEFNKLPSEIRKRFRNSPEEFLRFFEDENNRQEGIELGLINPNWTEETDGFGEHVKEGENKMEGEENG